MTLSWQVCSAEYAVTDKLSLSVESMPMAIPVSLSPTPIRWARRSLPGAVRGRSVNRIPRLVSPPSTSSSPMRVWSPHLDSSISSRRC